MLMLIFYIEVTLSERRRDFIAGLQVLGECPLTIVSERITALPWAIDASLGLRDGSVMMQWIMGLQGSEDGATK